MKKISKKKSIKTVGNEIFFRNFGGKLHAKKNFPHRSACKTLKHARMTLIIQLLLMGVVSVIENTCALTLSVSDIYVFVYRKSTRIVRSFRRRCSRWRPLIWSTWASAWCPTPSRTLETTR